MLGLYFALAIFSALLNEPHRQAIAAVAALVMHAGGKAAHQMDTEIADVCFRERSRNGRPQNLGRIECAPIILDPRDQKFAPALNLDNNFQRSSVVLQYMMMLATASSRQT